MAARACWSDGALITRSKAATRNWFEKTENCRTKWRELGVGRLPVAEPARVGVVGDDPVVQQVAVDAFEELAERVDLRLGQLAVRSRSSIRGETKS